MKSITITCDGSGTTNGHPGGYAAILRYRETVREVTGGFDSGTNNRAELLAAIVGLESLKESCCVVVRSDSEYVVKGIAEGRAAKWQRSGWKRRQMVHVPGCANRAAFVATGGMETVKNADLWERLLKAIEPHECSFVHVRGHCGDPDNERCDELAGAERARRIEDLVLQNV